MLQLLYATLDARHNAVSFAHVAQTMALDTSVQRSASPRHGPPLQELQRARLHAELAGMDALAAARAVAHAQRRCTGSAEDRLLFWHALYVELAPLNRANSSADAIATALSSLSLEARTAILLRLAEQLSPKAIGEVLAEPESRAARHLVHAVIELRQRVANGRSDGEWLREVTEWVHAHEPASARLQHAPAVTRVELPPAWIAETPRRRSNIGRIWLWLGLAGVLVCVGLARLVADDWLLLQNKPSAEPVTAVDPIVDLLALPMGDLALIDSDLNLSLLPRLDFYFWLAGRGNAIGDQAPNLDLPLTLSRHLLAAAADRNAAWKQLTVSERQTVLARLSEWRGLGAAQRAALRLNLPHWAALDAGEKGTIFRQYGTYLTMASAARDALDAEFEALSPTQRRALLPEVVSDQNNLARELFVFVPINEYAATMDMLAALSEEAKTDLRQLTRRLPPWQREALRVDLLTQSEDARAAWLKQRVSER